MMRYLARRLVAMGVVLLAVSVLVFFLIHLSGDPMALLAPLDARPEDVANLRREFGLDRPLWAQLAFFYAGLVRGDLGESFKYRQPALRLVMQRLPATLELAGASLALAAVAGVGLGVVAARGDGRPSGLAADGLLFVAISVPSFWLGLLLILLLADGLRWLPASGRGGPLHLVLPAVTLSAYSVGLVGRLVRGTLLEVLREPYIAVARAKGLAERRIFFRHALRNTLLPTVTVVGLQLGTFLGGSVVVESVFAWPGIGWLMYQGITSRDLPLVRAVTLVAGSLFALVNLAVDMAYAVIDPQIRYE